MRWFNLKAWFVIGMVAVASWTLVSAQQPPAPTPPPDGGPFTGSGPGGGARQEPGPEPDEQSVPDGRELADAESRHEVGRGDQFPAR